MEERKSVPHSDRPQEMIPNSTTTTPPPPPQKLETSQSPPPPAPAASSAARPPPHQTKKKRKADNADTEEAAMSKVRDLINDLRPNFVEILDTPDFRTSQAADEIQKKMERVMGICKHMLDPASVEMSKKPFVDQSLPGGKKDRDEVVDKRPEGKQGKHHHPDKSAELPLGGNKSEKLEDGQHQGSCLIGGSNLGWNFITYPSNNAVYYGVTKESHRIAKEKSGKKGTPKK